MAFDWKKTLQQGKELANSSKKIATEAFHTAADKGAELTERAGQKLDELDQKYGPQIEAGVKKLEDATTEAAGKVTKKVEELRGKKPDAPKQ
jgi:gas vesicle protein